MSARMEPGQLVPSELALEQRKDPALAQIIAFIEKEELPAEKKRAKAVVAQASVLTLVDNILLCCHDAAGVPFVSEKHSKASYNDLKLMVEEDCKSQTKKASCILL